MEKESRYKNQESRRIARAKKNVIERYAAIANYAE